MPTDKRHGEEKSVILLELPAGLKSRFRAVAAEAERSMAGQIRRLIEAYTEEAEARGPHLDPVEADAVKAAI